MCTVLTVVNEEYSAVSMHALLPALGQRAQLVRLRRAAARRRRRQAGRATCVHINIQFIIKLLDIFV